MNNKKSRSIKTPLPEESYGKGPKKNFHSSDKIVKNNRKLPKTKDHPKADTAKTEKFTLNPQLYLYGIHAVQAALDNENRVLKTLYLTPSRQEDFQDYANRVKIKSLSNEELSNLLPNGSVHQGIALHAILKDIKAEQDFLKSQMPIVILDGITDTHNIGAIMRSCAAFGVKDIIMQDKGAPVITGAMAKSAAGAVERVTLHKVVNLSRTINELQDAGFMVYCADGYAETNINDIQFSAKSVIVMGAEGSGVRPLVKKCCDLAMRIPITNNVESLNVSNAFAIILYTLSNFIK